MNVMIVDDSVEMRQLLREMVAPLTQDVLECEDGQECLDQFDAFRPAWTILDVRMPRLDGLSTTRSILERWPESRVILLTHFPSPAVAAVAREFGAVECVGKDDLFRVVDIMEQGGADTGHRPGPVASRAVELTTPRHFMMSGKDSTRPEPGVPFRF
jgi:CheY-like chemotaxis protein